MRRTDPNRPERTAEGSHTRAAAICKWLTACPLLLCIHAVGADHVRADGGGRAVETPAEFFLQDEDNPAEARDFFLEEAIAEPARPDEPLDFFMVNQADDPATNVGQGGTPIPPEPLEPEPTPAESPEPLTDSRDWGPSPVPGYSAPMTEPLEYSGGGGSWATIPAGEVACPPSGFGQCFDNLRCAHQQHWVNWRLSSDYLYGCMPEGYNGFPIIYSTSPSVTYSSPLQSGGFVEPGGNADVASGVGEPLRKPMTQLTTNVAKSGPLPDSTPEGREPRWHTAGTHRGWIGMAYYWDASHLAHQPPYFEDVNLERHGYSHGVVQPAVSAARFTGQFLLWPYALAVRPHHEVEYTLGEWRPGSAVPYVHDRPRPNLGGALFQAAVVTGLIFAVP